MALLTTATSCYRQRHDVIIYLAWNDGAKILSHPGRWDTLGWDNISPVLQIMDTYLSPKGENISPDVQILGTYLSLVGKNYFSTDSFKSVIVYGPSEMLVYQNNVLYNYLITLYLIL